MGNFRTKIENMYHFEVWDLGFNEMHGTVIFNEAVAMETACILLVHSNFNVTKLFFKLFT